MEEQNNDIQKLRSIIVRYLMRWYIFAAAIALCLTAAAYYYLSRPKSYHVSSSIMIKASDESSQNGMDQLDMLQGAGLFSGQRLTEDEIEILHSKTIMERTIRELDIQTIYEQKKGLKWVEEYPAHSIDMVYMPTFTDTIHQILKAKITRRASDYKVYVKYGKKSKTYKIEDITQPFETHAGTLCVNLNREIGKGEKIRITLMPLPIWAEQYLKQIAVNTVKRESNVVRLSTNSRCVRRSIDMLNKMVELYNADAVEYKNRLARATGQFIDERLALITEELAVVESDVEKYKKDNNLTDIKTESQLFLETANVYQQQTAQLETQRNIVTYVRDYIQQTPKELVPTNLGIEDEGLLKLVQEYNARMLTRQRLSRSTTGDNPVIAQIDGQLDVLRSNLLTTIGNVLESLRIALNDSKNKENAFMARIRVMPKQEREYIEIKRQQQVKESLYLFLIKKREENAITLASSLQPARTIDTADYNRTPVAPRILLLIMAAGVLGLILGIIFIFIRDMIFNTIEDKAEFERLVNAPFAGEICTTKSKKQIVVSPTSTSSTAELFRLLRTNILFALKGKHNAVILVTSTQTGEGKSFISSNLAASFALTGKKTLLVGLDIRSPQLAKYMSLDEGHLTEYLAGGSYAIEELAYHYSGSDNLDVVPAGIVPPNPGELLLNDRLEMLIEEWKKQYDIIILDTAPVGMVSDTYLINRFSDITLYVSRVNFTPRAAADFINEQHSKNKLNNMVCVLNGVPGKSRYGAYGAYGYGYGQKDSDE